MERLKILRDTISDVLEGMFFLVEETPPDQCSETYQFVVSIEDPDFEMNFFWGLDLAREITTNFLGVSESPQESEILDCLREVANMICGNFIGRAFPEHQISLPFPVSQINRTVPNGSDSSFALLFFRGQPMRIVYREHA